MSVSRFLLRSWNVSTCLQLFWLYNTECSLTGQVLVVKSQLSLPTIARKDQLSFHVIAFIIKSLSLKEINISAVFINHLLKDNSVSLENIKTLLDSMTAISMDFFPT
jgi:hypothetical protein